MEKLKMMWFNILQPREREKEDERKRELGEEGEWAESGETGESKIGLKEVNCSRRIKVLPFD